MRSSEKIAAAVLQELIESSEIKQLGLEILGLSLLAILPNKETARALDAHAREKILKTADDAVYARRNASIEQERKVKENEYNTEISIENKKRQVLETQLEAKQAVQSKESQLEKEKISYEIEIEQSKKELSELAAANSKILADSKAYELTVCMKAFEKVDKSVVQSLAQIGMDSSKLIAIAFSGLAENASKIGQLNITPDLLSDIIGKQGTKDEEID